MVSHHIITLKTKISEHFETHRHLINHFIPNRKNLTSVGIESGPGQVSYFRGITAKTTLWIAPDIQHLCLEVENTLFRYNTLLGFGPTFYWGQNHNYIGFLPRAQLTTMWRHDWRCSEDSRPFCKMTQMTQNLIYVKLYI